MKIQVRYFQIKMHAVTEICVAIEITIHGITNHRDGKGPLKITWSRSLLKQVPLRTLDFHFQNMTLLQLLKLDYKNLRF